jgi:hypothetical protein
MDEYELLIVADISAPIRNTIQEEADFVKVSSAGRQRSLNGSGENVNMCWKEKNSFQITHNPIHLLVCFGYQSPYAGEMFDIFSEKQII